MKKRIGWNSDETEVSSTLRLPDKRSNESSSFEDDGCSAVSRHGPANLKELKHARLFPVNFYFDEVSVDHKFKESLRAIVRMECDKAKAKTLIVYATRHPACGSCRREGRAMAELAAELSDVAFLSIVKDSTDIHESLIEYHEHYTPQCPIYQDPKMSVFQAFGANKLRFWPLVRGTTKQMVRARKLGIKINLVQLQRSDVWTQGGILIFRNTGTLFYSMPEPGVGKSLDMKELKRTVERCRQSCKNRSAN